MTGNFKDRDGGESNVVSTSTTTLKVIEVEPTHSQEGPEVIPNTGVRNSGDSSNLTDTIAAVVSAVLALVFLMLVVCVIRVIKKRRRERQGNRLSQPIVQTIAPGTFGANLAAYRNVPISGNLSWESVATSSSPIPRSETLEESLSSSGPSRELTSSSSCTSLPVSALIHQAPSTSRSPVPSTSKCHSSCEIKKSPGTSSVTQKTVSPPSLQISQHTAVTVASSSPTKSSAVLTTNTKDLASKVKSSPENTVKVQPDLEPS